MSAFKYSQSKRPRELRRRVVLPARLRAGAQWSDACILNISSRGLMIQSGRAGPTGTMVELRRGEHVIVAQIMWREGTKAGLRVEERLPVEEIMSVGQSKSLQLVASNGALVDRRRRRRATSIDARLRGRAFEFVSIGIIAVSLALGVWTMAEEAFAKPFAKVEATLAG